MDEFTKNLLVEKAQEALNYVHAPYSNYYVGAALLCEDGTIFTGCNIENDSILSICAERVALCKALSEGKKDFKAMVVVGKSKEDTTLVPTIPCGYCRQFMNEFCPSDFSIYTYSNKTLTQYTLAQLLPHSYRLQNK